MSPEQRGFWLLVGVCVAALLGVVGRTVWAHGYAAGGLDMAVVAESPPCLVRSSDLLAPGWQVIGGKP